MIEKIEFLHTRECHKWKDSLIELVEILEDAEINPKINIIEIKTQQDAEKHKFSGSPQININEKDVDPMAENITNYSANSCRPYFWKGKTFEYPPREMLEETVKKHGGNCCAKI